METTVKFISNEVFTSVAQIAANKGIDFDTDRAADYFKKTFSDKLTAIVNEANKDFFEAKKAFLGSDTTATTCFEVSIKHGCVMYANEILEYSKIVEEVTQ